MRKAYVNLLYSLVEFDGDMYQISIDQALELFSWDDLFSILSSMRPLTRCHYCGILFTLPEIDGRGYDCPKCRSQYITPDYILFEDIDE